MKGNLGRLKIEKQKDFGKCNIFKNKDLLEDEKVVDYSSLDNRAYFGRSVISKKLKYAK